MVLFLVDHVLNVLTLLLLFHLLDLKELIVNHFVSVIEDPLSDLVHIYLFGLLSSLSCILLLLFIEFDSFLHCIQLLLLPLHEYILLAVVTLEGIHLTLLLQYLLLVVSHFLGSLFLKFTVILALFLNLLHHSDFLCLHLLNLSIQGLELQLLLVERLLHLLLLSLFLFYLFQFKLGLI